MINYLVNTTELFPRHTYKRQLDSTGYSIWIFVTIKPQDNYSIYSFFLYSTVHYQVSISPYNVNLVHLNIFNCVHACSDHNTQN